MAGLPLRDWSKIINVINQLRDDLNNNNKKKFYEYTWDNFNQTFLGSYPTKIIDLPVGNEYEIIINNKSTNSIYLYQGEDGGEKLRINNSGWEVPPSSAMIFERRECTLWGISTATCNIPISINSVNPNPDKEMTIALDVELKVGTGTLLGRDIPLVQFAEIFSDWEQILRNIIDSDQGITGHKLAYLRSFQPGKTYEFNIDIDPAFTDFDLLKPEPIVIHLLDANQIQSALISSVAAMRGIQAGDLENTCKRMIGYAKSGGWVANLPPTGGSFSVTPGNSQSFLHFGAYTPNSSDACVITNFSKATNTFTLGGY